MSEEGAHTRPAVPLAASLTRFTEKLIARRNTMLGADFNRVRLKKRVEQRQCQFFSTGTISQA